jgi:hypothetical protein
MSIHLRVSSLALVALAGMGMGCAGVGLRPDGTPESEKCPKRALETMARLGLAPGDGTFILADISLGDEGPARFVEGPVVGLMDGRPMGDIPVGTRLHGRVWTGGREAVIRYYEAELPDGRRLPICAVAQDGAGGLVKRPDSPPGSAFLPDSGTGLNIVDVFP